MDYSANLDRKAPVWSFNIKNNVDATKILKVLEDDEYDNLEQYYLQAVLFRKLFLHAQK